MIQEEKKQGCIFGYARVSSTGQNLDRQIAELRKYVPEENIVTDKMSGKDLERPGYQALKGSLGLRRGDTLYIKSLDPVIEIQSRYQGRTGMVPKARNSADGIRSSHNDDRSPGGTGVDHSYGDQYTGRGVGVYCRAGETDHTETIAGRNRCCKEDGKEIWTSQKESGGLG